MKDAANTVHRLLAALALGDGRDGPDDAVRRRRHGRLTGGLSSAALDSSPTGYRHTDPGRRSLREPPFQPAAAVPGDHVAPGAPGGDGVGADAVRPDVPAAAGRLGDAVGGPLSDRPVRAGAVAERPAARPRAVRGAAEGAHRPRLPVLPDVAGALRGDPVSRADRQGRHPEAHGPLARPATRARLRRPTLPPRRTR